MELLDQDTQEEVVCPDPTVSQSMVASVYFAGSRGRKSGYF